MIKLDQKDSLAALFILIGAILRCYGFSDWSLSNDELSALHRLDYSSFSELIEKGIWVDGHPALVQVFLFYWTQFFGNSPLVVRLPFVLLSIGGLVYFYKLTCQILNKNAALFSLALFIPSQLFVLYGQIARPYGAGLFFILGFSFYLFKFLKKDHRKRSILISIFFGIAASLSHYFATLGVLILLFLGLFYLNKRSFRGYLLICLGIGLLFLPHLTITLNHLSIGGVGWLPPPKPDFIYRFIQYTLNQSVILYVLIGLGITSLLATKSLKFKLKEQITLLLLFILPYTIAYYYSTHKSPVLQFSVLIFCAPYFFLFLASFIKKESNFKLIGILSFLLISIGFYSLIFENKFYQKKQFANFKGVVKLSSKLENQIGKDNLISIANTNNADYFSYYIQLIDSTFQFDISAFSLSKQIGRAIELIDKSEKEYVLISFANVPVPAEVHEFAKQKFPIIEFHARFFNSEVILYKKGINNRRIIYQSDHIDYTSNTKWNVDENQLQKEFFYGLEDSLAYFQSIDNQYALNYKDTIKNLLNDSNKYITISALLKSDHKSNSKLVFSVEREGTNVYWRGIETAPFYRENEWYPFLYVFQKPDDIQAQDLVSIFFWNPDKSATYIDDFKLCNFEDSDYNYYEF
ncbi:MAG: glycosyltransferase family 39 protein [Flavobacteriales bacterium]|nr:glycosyltransferase family 39 protein [Flavobacteriales bacterium]